MKYEEWSKYKQMIDLRFKEVKCYKNLEGNIFYIEPSFYSGLQMIKDLYPDRYQEFLDEIDSIVNKNKVSVFCIDMDEAIVDLKDAKYVSIEDIANSLKIIIDFKSRGSDYGD